MPYNRGDLYERGGADVKFLYKSQEYNVEIKVDLKADYGQKMLKWDIKNKSWFWSVDDSVTQLYTSIGILDYVNQKNFTPNRFTISKEQITIQHKKQDQQAFEGKHTLNIKALYQFYSNKNCYYIQVGDYGFYHLERDILNLGTPQFNCGIYLRLRAKTIHSNPIYKYGFYAVIKTNKKPNLSIYDIEEKNDCCFPPII